MSNDKNKKKSSESAERAAFKHAIGMIESSGGKYLESAINPKTGEPYSSAAGKYHFLWKYISKEPALKGWTKRQFINDPEMQEKIMDMALDGKLEGYPNYERYGSKLKARYNSDLSKYELAALTHFLGTGGVNEYLSNPEKYNVPGSVNAKPNQYLNMFRKYGGSPKMEQEKVGKPNPIMTPGPIQDEKPYAETAKDNTQVRMPRVPRLTPQQAIQNVRSQEPRAQEYQSRSPVQNSEKSYNPLQFLQSYDEVENAHGGLIEFKNGGLHEENPYGGIPIGMNSQGQMNTVEEGESMYKDYVFSNRIGLGSAKNIDNYILK